MNIKKLNSNTNKLAYKNANDIKKSTDENKAPLDSLKRSEKEPDFPSIQKNVFNKMKNIEPIKNKRYLTKLVSIINAKLGALAGTIASAALGERYRREVTEELVVNKYSELSKKQEEVKEKFSNLQQELLKRYNLLPNVLNSVKMYIKHEDKIFENISKGINKNINIIKDSNSTIEAKHKAINELNTNLIPGFMNLITKYPEVKSDKLVEKFMNTLINTEYEVNFARESYNRTVKEYNQSIKKDVYDEYVSKELGFKPYDYLNATENTQKMPDFGFNK